MLHDLVQFATILVFIILAFGASMFVMIQFWLLVRPSAGHLQGGAWSTVHRSPSDLQAARSVRLGELGAYATETPLERAAEFVRVLWYVIDDALIHGDLRRFEMSEDVLGSGLDIEGGIDGETVALMVSFAPFLLFFWIVVVQLQVMGRPAH